MRRILAALLLVVFGSSLGVPLFAASSGQTKTLPMCCRRDGKHHCMIAVQSASQSSQKDASIGAPMEKCPYAPAAFVSTHGNASAPPQAAALFAALVAHPALMAQTESKLRISASRSRLKRGPPASILL